MGLDYRKALVLALRYSLSIRKLPYYFIFQVFVLMLVFFPLINLVELFYDSGIFLNAVPGPQVVDFVIESFGYFFLSIVFVLILSSVLTPTFIHNYVQYRNRKKDSLDYSFNEAKHHILTVFGAFITLSFLINIVGGIISMISKTLGTISGVVLTLVFLFVLQDIIIKKSNISESLESSFSFARKNMMAVIIVYLVVNIFSLIVTLLFGIPLILVLSKTIASLFGLFYAGASYSILITTLISAVKAELQLYFVSITVLLLGYSISKLFSMSFITEIYLELSRH